MIDGIDRAFQLRREEPILHILHFRRAHHEASAMDVYDGGQWIIGRDRPVVSTRIDFAPNALSTWISSVAISGRFGFGTAPASSSALARRCVKNSAVSGGSC